MLFNLIGDSLFLSSLTLCPLLLHPEFLRPPSGFCPQLCGPCPPATPDHLPTGGAWHQRPFQADHRGPGGHSGSWLTGPQPAWECRLAGGLLTEGTQQGIVVTTRRCCFKREQSGSQCNEGEPPVETDKNTVLWNVHLCFDFLLRFFQKVYP